MEKKPLAPSRALAAKVLFAALSILKAAGGALPGREVIAEIEKRITFNDWERGVYEKTGNTRWVSILHFFSIDAIKAGFLKKEKGIWTITNDGIKALELGERGLLDASGDAYVKWKASIAPDKDMAIKSSPEILEEQPPEELFEGAIKRIHDDLALEILDRLKACTPSFFERLVVAVLVKMGYGGTLADAAASITGRSGDEGIDGIINEDRLGLDAIYIQAKRWEAVIGRPEIQKFVGALQGQRAQKGVFITTSDFTREAQDYVKNISNKVILINGPTLARLMIENNVGVSVAATYEVKKIDSDYFSEE
jgi:restriction system protein